MSEKTIIEKVSKVMNFYRESCSQSLVLYVRGIKISIGILEINSLRSRSDMKNFNIDENLLNIAESGFEFRHHLHKIAEPSGEEFKTSLFCQEKMREFGYKVTTYEGWTGFIADLIVSDDAVMIAFRADMDALRMEDKSEGEFRSIHIGCAHNCGHDMHMAIALLSAKYLAMNKPKNNIRFIFQMAEEDAKIPGAEKMVELGCMDGVSEVYALHNDASLEYGEVHICNGIMSSYGSVWELEIIGKSAHGSTPYKGLDAIREGARLVSEMDYIIAKKIPPSEPAVFSVGTFCGGSVPNALADLVQMSGTIRCMNESIDKVLKESFEIFEQESALRGFKTRFKYCGYPAVINHQQCYEKVLLCAKNVLKDTQMLDAHCSAMTGSEDFSFMINATPNQKGAMFFLGSGNKSKGICNYLHSNPYYVEDKAIVIGAQIFILLANI